jgi:hypothetical protein
VCGAKQIARHAGVGDRAHSQERMRTTARGRDGVDPHRRLERMLGPSVRDLASLGPAAHIEMDS